MSETRNVCMNINTNKYDLYKHFLIYAKESDQKNRILQSTKFCYFNNNDTIFFEKRQLLRFAGIYIRNWKVLLEKLFVPFPVVDVVVVVTVVTKKNR